MNDTDPLSLVQDILLLHLIPHSKAAVFISRLGHAMVRVGEEVVFAFCKPASQLTFDDKNAVNSWFAEPWDANVEYSNGDEDDPECPLQLMVHLTNYTQVVGFWGLTGAAAVEETLSGWLVGWNIERCF